MAIPAIGNIFLYRMTHIANIPHILQYGITHKNSPNANSNYVSIGDSSLIDFRTTEKVQLEHSTIEITLGDCIPFYFGVRMPMLLRIQTGINVPCARKPEEIVYVVLSLAEIINSGLCYYFSDGHGRDNFSKFYDRDSIYQLPNIIDWNAVKAKKWSGDGIDTEIKRKKQAEFLINGDIAVQYIKGIVCYNETTATKLKDILLQESQTNLTIKVHPQSYY